MKLSDALIKTLEHEGVTHIFALPGEEIEDILFSLRDSSIKLITCRHEQGAAFMADVWGRLTGKAGVCLATLGPGATNLITGLADAHMDKAPVVALTGQADMKRMHKESHQYVDVVGMLRPITKWNLSLHDATILPEVVRKAFKLAQIEKPGVTHIEIPEDIAAQEVAYEPLPVRRVRRGAPDHQAIDAALELIRHAKKPMILAGNGASA
jgi:acetolactate synthase-1/2/3 large subunit